MGSPGRGGPGKPREAVPRVGGARAVTWRPAWPSSCVPFLPSRSGHGAAQRVLSPQGPFRPQSQSADNRTTPGGQEQTFSTCLPEVLGASVPFVLESWRGVKTFRPRPEKSGLVLGSLLHPRTDGDQKHARRTEDEAGEKSSAREGVTLLRYWTVRCKPETWLIPENRKNGEKF